MAAGSYERKEIKGGAARVRLTADVDDVQLSFATDGSAGWPTGAVDPFEVVIGRGTATEEKLLVATRTGNSFAVATRGYDDTAGYQHTIGDYVEHIVTASTIDQANRYVNEQLAKGDLMAHNGVNPVRVPAPLLIDAVNNGKVLMVKHDAVGGWEIAILPTVIVDAGTPDVDAAVRIWLDTNQQVLRPSDGASWLLPANVYHFDDVGDRATYLGGDPPIGTTALIGTGATGFVEVYDGTGWIRFSRGDQVFMKFPDAAARDAVFTAPTTGDHAYLLDVHQLTEYREDEWILLNQKITVSATQPATPRTGDVWLQPL